MGNAKATDFRCGYAAYEYHHGHPTLTGKGDKDIVSAFWEQWQELRDQLYRCCLKLMNFNAMDAEDVLSQAMLKAWEKVQKHAGKIDNLKAWLMQLTRNFCIDIIHQRSRGPAVVDSLEWVGKTDIGTASAVETPEKALERDEKARVIEEAIASLPERLRHTFILHFYQQRSHTEIAEAQGITYDNVCKRISLARKHLKQQLSGYFLGTNGDVNQKNNGAGAVETTCTQTKPTCAGLKTSDLTLVGVRVSVPDRVDALGWCSRERPSPPTGESGEKPQKMETETVSAEKESVEEVEAETLEFVDSSVESRELVSQTIQETATLSAERCVEVVKAEILEFVESFVELRELVSQSITEVGNRSSKLPLLSRLHAVKGGELPVLLPSSILDNTKSGLTTLFIGVLKVLPILKSLSQWGFMRRIWDRTLADTGGGM